MPTTDDPIVTGYAHELRERIKTLLGERLGVHAMSNLTTLEIGMLEVCVQVGALACIQVLYEAKDYTDLAIKMHVEGKLGMGHKEKKKK